MGGLSNVASALAILAMPAVAQPAQLASAHCYSAEELRDMIIVGLPATMDVARDKCQATLGPNSFITSRPGREFVDRLRVEALPKKAGVIASYRRIMAVYGAPSGNSDSETFSEIYDAFVMSKVASINSGQCRSLNALIEALSPLTPSNFGAAIAATYGLVDAREEGVLCRL